MRRPTKEDHVTKQWDALDDLVKSIAATLYERGYGACTGEGDALRIERPANSGCTERLADVLCTLLGERVKERMARLHDGLAGHIAQETGLPMVQAEDLRLQRVAANSMGSIGDVLERLLLPGLRDTERLMREDHVAYGRLLGELDALKAERDELLKRLAEAS